MAMKTEKKNTFSKAFSLITIHIIKFNYIPYISHNKMCISEAECDVMTRAVMGSDIIPRERLTTELYSHDRLTAD
jgi:hypothetical protein